MLHMPHVFGLPDKILVSLTGGNLWSNAASDPA